MEESNMKRKSALLLLLAIAVLVLALPSIAAAKEYEFPRTHKCPVCGEQAMIIDGEAPTCTEAGWASYRCYRTEACQVFRVKLKKLGHDWKKSGEKAATCTKNGYRDYYCTRPGCGLGKRDTIKALGHSWGAWKVTKPATTPRPVHRRTPRIQPSISR